MLLAPLTAEPRLILRGTFVPPAAVEPRIAHWREVLSRPQSERLKAFLSSGLK